MRRICNNSGIIKLVKNCSPSVHPAGTSKYSKTYWRWLEIWVNVCKSCGSVGLGIYEEN